MMILILLIQQPDFTTMLWKENQGLVEQNMVINDPKINKLVVLPR